MPASNPEAPANRRAKQAELPPIPSEAIAQLPRPSILRYRSLVADLVRANQAAEAGDDQLYVILKCVVGVLHFLDADPEVRGSSLARPLAVLAKSLRDLGQGARPPLFFDRPMRRTGRPANVSFEGARGAIAAAVAMLVKCGERRETAGKYVAALLGEIGVKLPSGKPILPKQVLRWRDEIGSAASNLAESTYRDAWANYMLVPPEMLLEPDAPREYVRGSLAAVRSMGF